MELHGLNATVALPLADRATSLAAAIEEGLWQHAVVEPSRRNLKPAKGTASRLTVGSAAADLDAGRLAYEVCVCHLMLELVDSFCVHQHFCVSSPTNIQLQAH